MVDWLYVTTSLSVLLTAFLVFTLFFVRELLKELEGKTLVKREKK